MARFRTRQVGANKPPPGMSRFFSRTNLARYRKLASGAIGEAEQGQLLADLAEEMKAFRREACVAAAGRPPSFNEDIGSRAGDRI